MTSSAPSLPVSLNLSRTEFRQAVQRELARRHLTDFKQALYRRYLRAPHLDLLDTYLMKVSHYVETGGDCDPSDGVWLLIVEMPPRHGKTLTVSRLYPAWHLGRNPDHRVMLVSYGDSLAIKNGRAVRNLINNPVYAGLYPGVALAADSKAADAFNIAGREGGVDALGVLGGATGKGAHVLVADDLVKNRAEAESETLRERTWDAFADDLMSRLEPGGAAILNATRWHMDDPTGRVLRDWLPNEPPGRIVRLRLPAIAEAPDKFADLLGRAEGEALWPERYPIEVLRGIEQRSGPYSFASLYQQNPVPAEGGLFKRVYFQRLPASSVPPLAYTVRGWDLAMSEKTSADYTAGVQLALGTDGHVYILDAAHGQIEWGNVTEFLAGVMLRDGAHVPQGIEEKGFMTRAITQLNVDPRLRGFQVWGYPADRDKLTRALPFAAKCAANVVHIVESHWTETFIEELCSFPSGAHDDLVDAASIAWTMLSEAGAGDIGGLVHADHHISPSPY